MNNPADADFAEQHCVVDRWFAVRTGLALVGATSVKLAVAGGTVAFGWGAVALAGLVPIGWGWWLFLAVVVTVWFGSLILAFIATVRHGREMLPVGSELSVRFGRESWWEKSPLGESVIRYDTYDRIVIRHGFVLFLMRRGSVGNILPLELFPSGECLIHVQSRLAPRR